MASLKDNQVDRWIAKPDGAFRIILIFGPDAGLVSERADRLSKSTGVDLSDPFSLIRLNADDVAEDKSRLLDEVFTVGMFGGERLIRVSGTTRRNLAEAVKPVIEQKPEDAWIIIEAGDLKAKTGLRGMVEKSPHAMAIPCYQDSDTALRQLISEELTDNGLQISANLQTYLAGFLGGDRQASRNELRKLALYAHGETEITREHIDAVVGDASTIDINALIDAVAAGDMTAFEHNLDRVLMEGTSPDMVIINTMRHFQTLHELRGKMENYRLGSKAVVDGARPPIFWKRKEATMRILSRLDTRTIEKVLARLETAAFEARSKPDLADAIAGTSLLASILTINSTR